MDSALTHAQNLITDLIFVIVCFSFQVEDHVSMGITTETLVEGLGLDCSELGGRLFVELDRVLFDDDPITYTMKIKLDYLFECPHFFYFLLEIYRRSRDARMIQMTFYANIARGMTYFKMSSMNNIEIYSNLLTSEIFERCDRYRVIRDERFRFLVNHQDVLLRFDRLQENSRRLQENSRRLQEEQVQPVQQLIRVLPPSQ